MLTNNRYYFRIREFVPPAVASDKAQYTTVARQHGAASPRISWDALLIFSVPSNYSCLSDPCVNGRGTDMTIREFQVQGREDGSGSRPLSLSLSLSLQLARHEATLISISYCDFLQITQHYLHWLYSSEHSHLHFRPSERITYPH